MQLEHLGKDVGLLEKPASLPKVESKLASSSDKQCMVWLEGAAHDGDTERIDGWKQSSIQELVSENLLSKTVRKLD